MRETTLRRVLAPAVLAVVFAAALAAVAQGQNQSADGWPPITGMLLMNKTDSSRPLDARPGRDPFGGQDRRYSCDAVHKRGKCQRRLSRCGGGRRCVTRRPGHNELLGGHGNDTIHAGRWGDVLWGDYKPSGQPTTQRDRIWGGNGRDFIYASHGWNTIRAGGGNDFVKAHFGRGIVDCGGGRDTLYISRRAKRSKRYRYRRCERISHKTRGG
jgi:RTX calcium-binding nonapeptide repeat (4 copies)